MTEKNNDENPAVDGLVKILKLVHESNQRRGGRAGPTAAEPGALGDWLAEAAKLQLEHHQRLWKLGSRFAETLVPRPCPVPGSVQETLTLRAHVGETAQADLKVKNAGRRKAEVEFLISPFRLRDDSERRVRPSVRFQPDGLSLAGGAEKEVRLEIPLDGSVFAAGQVWLAEIEVRAVPVIEVHVVLEILAAAGPTAGGPGQGGGRD